MNILVTGAAGVMRVMAKVPERKNGEDGLPIPPHKVTCDLCRYNSFGTKLWF